MAERSVLACVDSAAQVARSLGRAPYTALLLAHASGTLPSADQEAIGRSGERCAECCVLGGAYRPALAISSLRSRRSRGADLAPDTLYERIPTGAWPDQSLAA